MERFMKQDLALFTVEHASKPCADWVDVMPGPHYNELIIVVDDKIQREVINRKRGMTREC